MIQSSKKNEMEIVKRLKKINDLFADDRESGSFHSQFHKLLESKPNWRLRIDTVRPLYALPTDSNFSDHLASFFPHNILEAELRFSKLCKQFGYVGINSNNIGITFPPLVPIPHLSNEEKNSFIRNSPYQRNGDCLGAIHERLLGYHGFLYSNKIFLAELEELRSMYSAINLNVYPIPNPLFVHNPGDFPLAKPVQDQSSDPLCCFYLQLKQFKDKWNVTEVITWDLVATQGPRWPDLLPVDSPARCGREVSFSVPSHFTVLAKDRNHEMILEEQKSMGLEDRHVAELLDKHSRHFQQVARLIHLENTLRSRFGGDLPWGFATTLFDMGVDYLQVGNPGHIKRIRLLIGKYKVGDYSSISDQQ